MSDGMAEIGLAAVMDMEDFDAGSQRYMETNREMEGQTESSAEGMSSSLGKVGESVLLMGGIIMGAGIAALAAFGAAAYQLGDQFDVAFDSLIINTGETGDALQGLKDDFKEVFTSVPTDTETASTAISILNQRLELTGSSLTTVAKPLLEVTRLTGGSIRSNAEALSGTAQDWSISNENLAGTLDKVFVASQKTGANFGTLLNQMDNFGPILKSMGFGFEDSIALLSGLEEAGVNTGSVMMGLRMATKKLADSGKPMNEAFADVIASIKGAATETDALSIASSVFGSRAGIELTNAIRSGKFELEDLTAVIKDAGGNIMDTSAKTMDFAENWTLLKNKASAALEPIGTQILGVATTAVVALTPLVEKLISALLPAITQVAIGVQFFVDQFLKGVEAGGLLNGVMEVLDNILSDEVISAIWTFIDGMQNVLTVISTFVTTVLIPFVYQHLEEFKGALIAIGAVLVGAAIVGGITSLIGLLGMLLNPIGLIVVAIGLLGAAWAGNWGGIRDILTQVWEQKLKPALTDLWTWLKENLPIALQFLRDTWINVLKPALEVIWDFIKNYLIPILIEVVTWVAERVVLAAQNAADTWTNYLKPALEVIWNFIKDPLIPIIMDIVTWVGTHVVDAVQKAADYWNNTLKPALDAVWSFIDTYLMPIFEDVVEIVGLTLTGAIQSLTDYWNDTLLPAMRDVRDYINTYLVPIFQAIWDKVDSVASIIRDTLAPVFNTIRTGALALITTAFETLKGVLKDIKDWLDKIIAALKLVEEPDITTNSILPTGLLGGSSKGIGSPISGTQSGLSAAPLMSIITQSNVVINMGGQTLNNGLELGGFISLIDSRVKVALGG